MQPARTCWRLVAAASLLFSTMTACRAVDSEARSVNAFEPTATLQRVAATNSDEFRYANAAPPSWTVARFRLENTGSTPIVYRAGDDGLIAEFELRSSSGEWEPTAVTDCAGLLGVNDVMLEPRSHVLLWMLLRTEADHTHLRIPIERAQPTGEAPTVVDGSPVYTAAIELNRS